jgi:acetyl-CoA C-acetyltransferase
VRSTSRRPAARTISADRSPERPNFRHEKAARATEEGAFAAEILALEGVDTDGDPVMHDRDEGVRFDANLDAISKVKPFSEKNLLTAATASQICDGASGVMIVSKERLQHTV